MIPTLNPDYELVYVDQETDKIFLKNHFFKNMVSLSKIEYEIIQFYIDHPDYEKVFAHYSQRYEMSRDFVYTLIHKAELSGILVSEGYLARKEKVRLESGSRVNNILMYMMVSKLQAVMSLLSLKAKLELRGNFKYYRLVSFGLENTWLEKWCSNSVVQLFLVTLYFVLLGTVLYGITSIDVYIIPKNSFQGAFDRAFWIIPIALIGFLIFTILHELGHFLVYKRYGGLTSEMGVALMTGIIPTLYVTTSSLHLWKSRTRRLLVMAGGTLVDVLLLLTCLYFTYASISNTISFYGYLFSIMMVYRILFNINPFIPRTDGYFMLCEITSQPTFHSSSYTHFSSLLAKMKNGKWRHILFSEAGYSFYFMLSMVFIVVNYLILLSPVIVFLYYLIIGGRR